MDKKVEYKKIIKKTWHFIWEDNSIWSWLVNIILAFVLIKFIVYPGLGFLLNTTHPVVAVVSRSMEHNYVGFDKWWELNKNWYLENGITKENFTGFPFRNGFNKGDIFVLKGKTCQDVRIGEIIVFRSARPDPIIHRSINKWIENGYCYIQTKGDNNADSIRAQSLDETKIREDQLVGKALWRIPYLGYIKIGFVCAIYGVQGKDSFFECLMR